jgi:hypothetical protein
MTKISALSDIGTSVASNDAFVLVDVSDPTTPNKKIQQQNLFLIPDGSAGTPAVRFLNDTDVGLFRPTTNTLALATGGSERLRIDSSGRVGIGTSAPQKTLHVQNPGSAYQADLRLGGTSNYYFDLTHDSTTTGKTIYNAYAVAGAVHGHQFQVSGTNALLIDSSGRVGIGTTSPGYKLDVTGGGIGVNTSAGTAASVVFNQSGIGVAEVGMPASENALTFKTWTGATLAERARIDSSGRLLVGTSSTSGNIAGNDKLAVVITGENTKGGISVTDYAGVTSTVGSYAALRLQRSLGTTDGTFTALTAAQLGIRPNRVQRVQRSWIWNRCNY